MRNTKGRYMFSPTIPCLGVGRLASLQHSPWNIEYSYVSFWLVWRIFDISCQKRPEFWQVVYITISHEGDITMTPTHMTTPTSMTSHTRDNSHCYIMWCCSFRHFLMRHQLCQNGISDIPSFSHHSIVYLTSLSLSLIIV